MKSGQPRGVSIVVAFAACLATALALVSCASLESDPGTRLISNLFTGTAVQCETESATSSSGVLRAYTINADGSLNPVNSPINGEDCDPSTFDDGRASTMSPPFNPSTYPLVAPTIPTPHATSTPQPEQVFGTLLPLPFSPRFNAASMPASPDYACTPNTSIYMVNHFANTVTHYGVCPLSIIKRIQVGTNPLQLQVTPDGKTVVVTCYDGIISFIDVASDTVTASLNTPSAYPNGIAITPDGSKAYVTSYIDTSPAILVIDLNKRAIASTIPIGTAYPKSIVLTPDGLQAWILSYQSRQATVFDTLTNTVTFNVSLGGQGDTGMAFNPTGTRAYVALAQGRVAVFDTSTLANVASIPVAANPNDIVITPAGDRAFVNSTSSAVISTIDLTTNTVTGTVRTQAPAQMGLVLFH